MESYPLGLAASPSLLLASDATNSVAQRRPRPAGHESHAPSALLCDNTRCQGGAEGVDAQQETHGVSGDDGRDAGGGHGGIVGDVYDV